MKSSVFTLLIACLFPLAVLSQQVIVKGSIRDARSGEPVLFANVYLSEASFIGTTSDEYGQYMLKIDLSRGRHLEASALGYQTQSKVIVPSTDTLTLDFQLESTALALDEIVIEAGENPAHILLRRLIAAKKDNNFQARDSFSAEVYSKLEMDVLGVSQEVRDNRLLNSFDFVFDHIDTTQDGKSFLPGYFSETIQQVYIQNGKWVEIPLARKVSEIGNESIIRLLNTVHDRFDLYDNWIPVVDKAFASPFSDNGLANYEYYLIDSTFLDGRWSYQLKFKPRRKQEFTFTGTCWIDSLSGALRTVHMEKSAGVNINLLHRIEIHAEFRFSALGWVPDREDVLLEYALGETEKLPGIIARKTNRYQKISYTTPNETVKPPDPRMFDPNQLNRGDTFWEQYRPEPLSPREAGVYSMVDSIGKSPAFQRFKKLAYVAGSGYLPWGNVEFGPFASTYSNNSVEGSRIRFGMGSSLNWSRKWWLYGYAAYGIDDQRWKYGGHVQWQPSKRPWTTFRLSYKDDLELSFSSSGEVNEDNFFAGIYRRNIPQKLMYTKQAQGNWEQDFTGGWTALAQLRWQQLEPYTRAGLGFPFYFQTPGGDPFQGIHRSAEVEFRMRWAPANIYVETNFNRILTGSQDSRPAIEPFYAFGLYGKNTYYHHVGVRMAQWFNLPPIGWIRYHLNAGVLTNTLPNLLLHSPAANETYLYVPNAFNTLSRYEFVSDTYLDAVVVHHLDGFFFNRIPLLRRLKWREVLTLRMAYGTLRKTNQLANTLNVYDPTYTEYQNTPIPGEGIYYGRFDRGPLLEAGVGIENIFKVVRIDATWRLNYLRNRYAVPLSLRGALTFYF